jgi:hypothetical protein
MFALLTLLFPDGRLPSARWRLSVAIVLFPMALEVGFLAIAPIRNEGLARNPIGIDSELIVAIVPIIDTVANLALLSALVLGLAAVGTRFRHGDAVTRQQLKWFLASLPPFVGLFIISSNEETTQTTVLDVISTASLALLPITICIAILRYRLWEIDRLISRTIGWAAVSAVVLAVFAAGLLALQAVLTDVTQGETLAVAASTLLALATFQPLRRRIQGIVDRRFDRARFDGERVVEGFAGRLRDQFDLDVLVEGLVGVVTETVRPATAVVWLRTHRNERQTLQP